MKKDQIKNILIPVDFTETSNNALEVGLNLASFLKAKILLLHILEINPYTFSVIPEVQAVIPSTLDLTRTVQQKLEELKDEINTKNKLKVETYVKQGHIHSEIISFSKKKKADLIIMGTHGASGIKELFIGSNAQRVVTLSDIPVLTIKDPIGQPGFKNILIPIDNSLHSREKINIAMLLASLYKAKIHLVGLPASKVKQELNKFQIKLDSVEKIIRKARLPFVTSLAPGSSLAKSAMDYASKNKCDLIVINTGHESKMSGIFLGAFAVQIVNHSKVPVLSIRHLADHYVIDTPGFAI